MSKLKTLSDDDLISISENFSEFLNIEISKRVSIKELDDIDLGITINYENDQLDVSVDVDLLFDELTDISEESLNMAVDNAYERLDSFIDENFRE
ncbi:MAG: DUF3194 domain-containing protein [Methanobrevibacter sp.]|uniref:DUF3194 domain-containing protein n=1 Tax=Methanobrevibacter sp. TaxID=66852 RepID=UPI0026E0EE37|nr:DUF3194 domain-containing protein [Methanobrevibacter sp.]MDO5849379.1 DUF3194 domain-containing protein [Methanobrevibacter sp.]